MHGKKNKFVDGKEIYGKTFNQSEISSVARFLNFRNDQMLSKTVKLVGFFGRLLEILPPPPTCQCAAPRPTWSGPAHLPPASLSPQKNKTRKVYYFTKEKKKFVVAHSPFFHWFHPRLMAIVVTLNLSPRFYKWYSVTKIVLTYFEKKLNTMKWN